jgi:DNA-binding transcriptional ArsR family regulator
MGITKADIYLQEDLDMAAMAKALGHPARIAIILILLKSNQCITGDLSEQIGLAQPTVSQHLKELKAIELIQGTVSGTSVNYCINPIRWKEIAEHWAQLFSQFPTETPPCC